MSMPTTEQLSAAKNGQPVRFHELDTDFVLIRADLYDRVRAVFEDDVIDGGAVLVNEIMAEDDAKDPLLDGYQRYRQP